MKIYAISDLHLSTTTDKPMDIFGPVWDNHFEKIKADWQCKVTDEDIVLLPGDFSWAMTIDEVKHDFDLIAGLKGKKVILRGNHDYWWNTLRQVREMLPSGVYALQNDIVKFGNTIICGTRGWQVPEASTESHDVKIYKREIERLKLSLSALSKVRSQEDRVIAIMHYPPFNVWYDQSDFIKLYMENDIKTVVYGHLHGKDSRVEKTFSKFGMNFYLVSTDIVNHKLVEIV